MIEPHGGNLVNRVRDSLAEDVLHESIDGEIISLDQPDYQNVINIACGRFSPLTGFMTQNDFLKVIEDMALEDGTVWPLPVVLDVDSSLASSLAPNVRAGLEAPNGELMGYIDIEEVYTYNDTQAARQIFGTDDSSHPGVASLYEKEDFLVGGDITMLNEIRYHSGDLFPTETRVLFQHNEWEKIAGFQTRNVPHRAHEYIQKSALELVDGLLIQPKLGDKKVNDYTDDAIFAGYRTLISNYYPPNNVSMSCFPSKMRYAGPREAVFDAIVRKNQGCTHFIVGRDHAGVQDYYDEMAAQEIFEKIPDIGVTVLAYDYAFYCHLCDGMASEKTCPHDDNDRVYPSGTRIRQLFRDGETPSDKLIRPEVGNVVLDMESPFVTEETH